MLDFVAVAEYLELKQKVLKETIIELEDLNSYKHIASPELSAKINITIESLNSITNELKKLDAYVIKLICEEADIIAGY